MYNYLKMYKFKRAVVIFFVFFLIFIFQTTASAVELNIPKTTINPDNYLLYSFKRIFEKAIYFTKFSKEAKVDYYKSLILIRTAELQTVVNQRLLGEVQKSTQRLSYQVGIISDYLAENKDLSKNKEDIVNTLSNLKTPLENLRDKFPANSSYWMLVQHDINSIDLNLQKLK